MIVPVQLDKIQQNKRNHMVIKAGSVLVKKPLRKWYPKSPYSCFFLRDSCIRSSVSQRGFKISWATRSNHISSLHNRSTNWSCPFQSKSQGSWQESWEVTEREREPYEDRIHPLQNGPDPKFWVTSWALTAWGSVFSGATLAPISIIPCSLELQLQQLPAHHGSPGTHR